MGVLKVRCSETGHEASTGIEKILKALRRFPTSSQVPTARYAGSTTLLEVRHEVCRGTKSLPAS